VGDVASKSWHCDAITTSRIAAISWSPGGDEIAAGDAAGNLFFVTTSRKELDEAR
jgi:hypothetical protein